MRAQTVQQPRFVDIEAGCKPDLSCVSEPVKRIIQEALTPCKSDSSSDKHTYYVDEPRYDHSR
jgi:hypothetical protein